jgi:hypothetical protein
MALESVEGTVASRFYVATDRPFARSREPPFAASFSSFVLAVAVENPRMNEDLGVGDWEAVGGDSLGYTLYPR